MFSGIVIIRFELFSFIFFSACVINVVSCSSEIRLVVGFDSIVVVLEQLCQVKKNKMLMKVFRFWACNYVLFIDLVVNVLLLVPGTYLHILIIYFSQIR